MGSTINIESRLKHIQQYGFANQGILDYREAVEDLKQVLPSSLLHLKSDDELAVLQAAVSYIKLLQKAIAKQN